MILKDTDSENVNGSAMEVKSVTQSLEDEGTKKLPAEAKSSSCKGLKAFLAALAFTYFSKVFSAAMMKSSFTQLERRFGISSSTAGFMDGGFELGNLLVISFVSYFGAKFHRPRVIALGCFIMSLGSFLTAMPHFFMGYYKYETLSRASENSTFNISPCLLNQTVRGLEGMPGSGCDKEVTSYAWIYVLMGNLLRGIGETPVTPLGISYLDDFSREEDTPFYIGCLHTIAMIGPMVGFLLGSLLAKLYVDIGFVDLDTVTITPTDSRWVGAWWLGFLVAGIINLISGIPFCFLPKSLDKEGENASVKKTLYAQKMNGDESHVQKSESQQEVGFTTKLKGFFKSLKRVLGNRMYFTLLCVSLLQFSSFIGYLTYTPKYIEQQYGQPATKSNFVTAVTSIPAVCLGIFLGGLIMKKYKLSIIAATKMAFSLSFLAYLISLLYLAVGCENRTVAGLTVSYDGQPVEWDTTPLSAACNLNCNCATNQWDPVCGDNGITYVSACFAGCKDMTGSRKETIFHNCSCIGMVDSLMRNSSAVLGECLRSDYCSRNFIYHTAIKTASSFFFALGGTPFYMIMIRCVHQELKSLAVGLYMLILRALEFDQMPPRHT
ncbi:solute carrier organic anion transporter family member 1B3-like isoform X2 [Rhineura floridana]|uniref:solute carrier organic anion transporter family member 1B3-like isoform X2 n=1 Tax=Rhineura floridana TaxID=261503 RepID=UPI002AC801F1|nr:solute carrier organic anion transporter family member 1B3-like isoform X2 [Rhineura floridana]XP_061492747.1 solute carrier organic anion transporter family member 1B3-like isoform X2 [Rhineura floridana]